MMDYQLLKKISVPAWDRCKGSSESAHYTVFGVDGGHLNYETSLPLLKQLFPNGEADDMNVCLFSTSGVHGTYNTIEDCEKTIKKQWTRKQIKDGCECDTLTFLVIQPRIVCLRYGVCEVKTLEDVEFLKKLRATSWAELAKIGIDWAKPAAAEIGRGM